MLKNSTVHESLALLADAGQMSEALALLIGAVAHDFRNHLTVIQCWSNVVMRPGTPKEKVAAYVERILGAAASAIQLTEQLQVFSNPHHANTRVVNLDEVIGDVVKLAEDAVEENIRLRVDDCPDLGKVRVEYGRFQQALLCAILNARDAMPQGGEITVRASQIAADENAAVQPPGASLGENVLVTVTSIESAPGKGRTIKMYLPRVTKGEVEKVAS